MTFRSPPSPVSSSPLFSFHALDTPACPNSELPSVTMDPFRQWLGSFNAGKRLSTKDTTIQKATNIAAFNGIRTPRFQCSWGSGVASYQHVVSLKIISKQLHISQCVKDLVPSSWLFLLPPSPSMWLRKPTWHGQFCWNVDNLKHDTEMGLPMWWRHMAEVQTGTSLVLRQPIKSTDHHLFSVTYGPTQQQRNSPI